MALAVTGYLFLIGLGSNANATGIRGLPARRPDPTDYLDAGPAEKRRYAMLVRLPSSTQNRRLVSVTATMN
jgi:hypothetical protein